MVFNNVDNRETILVYIDPSRTPHIALDRALVLSRLKQIKPKLHLFVIDNIASIEGPIHSDAFCKQSKVLDWITQTVDSKGLDYTVEYCDSLMSFESVLDCAERLNPVITLIADYDGAVRVTTSCNSAWGLSRKSCCPVMILRPGATSYSEYGFMLERNSVSSLSC